MSDISKIDKNFAIETKIEKEGIKFYDPEKSPFSIHGVFREGESLVRLPESVARGTNDGVLGLYRHTAGGRIRFVTDSPYVAISVKYNVISKMTHIALAGSAGFDVFVDGKYSSTFRPDWNVTEHMEGLNNLPEGKKCVTINMPLYAGVDKIYIGLDENAVVEKAPEYTISKPVVYYGSSITQGGCASKPGSCYQSILERRFDFDYVNLGFSGSARGEDCMADYIASLDMSLFVYDYDHNAPSHEHLLNTHERMFLRIREKNPELPIIMMSRPRYESTPDVLGRLDIIKRTYANAIARGDKKVWLIDGRELMSIVKDNGTVDGCHPTDSGFFNMAKRLGDEIEKNYSLIFG